MDCMVVQSQHERALQITGHAAHRCGRHRTNGAAAVQASWAVKKKKKKKYYVDVIVVDEWRAVDRLLLPEEPRVSYRVLSGLSERE